MISHTNTLVRSALHDFVLGILKEAKHLSEMPHRQVAIFDPWAWEPAQEPAAGRVVATATFDFPLCELEVGPWLLRQRHQLLRPGSCLVVRRHGILPHLASVEVVGRVHEAGTQSISAEAA